MQVTFRPIISKEPGGKGDLCKDWNHPLLFSNEISFRREKFSRTEATCWHMEYSVLIFEHRRELDENMDLKSLAYLESLHKYLSPNGLN